SLRSTARSMSQPEPSRRLRAEECHSTSEPSGRWSYKRRDDPDANVHPGRMGSMRSLSIGLEDGQVVIRSAFAVLVPESSLSLHQRRANGRKSMQEFE